MYRRISLSWVPLALALFLSFLTETYAQEQSVVAKAKVIKFSQPFTRINLEFYEEQYRGFSEIAVDSVTVFLNKKGNAIKPENINEGAEVEVNLIRKGYKTNLISVRFLSETTSSETTGAVKSPKAKPTYATETFTGRSTFAVGRGLGSNLGRDIDFTSSKLGWGVYVDRIGKIKIFGEELTKNKYAFFTLGAYVGWKTYESTSELTGLSNNNQVTSFETYQRWRYFVVGGRTTLHLLAFRPWKRWDPYAGFMLSYNFLGYEDNSGNSNLVALPSKGSKSGNYDYYNPVKSNGKLSFFVGSRYYLLRRLAAFAELGYGISYLQFGLSLNTR